MDGMIEIQVECPRCKEKRTVATIEGDGTRYSYCRTEFHKQHNEALKLLDRCVKAIRKAKRDYNMGWNKAIEQRPLSDAADDAAAFLLTVKDPAGTLS